jgi:DNA invertase Pin-like site-specific DNA recombinase
MPFPKDDMHSKVMRTMLGLFAEIERDLIKMRVNEGVKAAQEKGVKFGRPIRGVGLRFLNGWQLEKKYQNCKSGIFWINNHSYKLFNSIIKP